MGWLSTIAKLGAVGAAPFTGGASLAALPAISAMSQIAGSAAASREKGRNDATALNTQRDALAGSQFNTAQNAEMQAGQLDLQRQQFADQQRGARTKQAMLGDLLANIQDVNIDVPGITAAKISGGLRPSAMSARGRQAGEQLNQQALQKLLQGDTFTGGQLLQRPGLTPMPKPNAMDSILGALGTYGSLASGVLGALPERGGQPQPPSVGSFAGVPAGLPGAIDVNDLFNRTRPGVA